MRIEMVVPERYAHGIQHFIRPWCRSAAPLAAGLFVVLLFLWHARTD